MAREQNQPSAEIVAPPPRYLANIPIFQGAEDLIEQAIERAMSAESPEALLADPQSGSLRDYAGSIITITHVLGIMPSRFDVGNYYIVFEAVVGTTGETVTLSTGSAFAVPRIAKLSAENWLPRMVRVLELESASNPGQASLWITDAQPELVEAINEPF